MARAVSQKVREHVQSEVDPLVKVFLITINHEDLAEPIRVSSDPTVRVGGDQTNIYYGTISKGRTFYYAGFDANLANDEDGAVPQVELSIPNASPEIIRAIESMGSGPVSVDIELVFAETPDNIEIELKGMELSEITYDESSISGTVSRDLLFSEPYPYQSFTPTEYPNLFASRRTVSD